MLISRNPAATLELSYVWQKLQPSNLDAVKETDYVIRGGQRNRLRRDKKGNIVFLPTPRHDVAETKRGRAGTTERVASATMIARVLSAAERQPQAKADFLRFLYDVECAGSVRMRIHEMGKARMMGMIPASNVKKRERAIELVWPLLLHFSQLLRCGIERYSEAELCKFMGFVNTRDASYAKEYRRIVGDFLLQLQDLEQVAMKPVVDVVRAIFQEPERQRPKHYSGPSVANDEPPTPPAEVPPTVPIRLPAHKSILPLKRAIASI